MSDQSGQREVAAATRTLALLNAQADGLRAHLEKLQLNLVEVQRDVSGNRAAQLLEANGKLVLAVLHADTIAETAINNLSELTRSSQRDALTHTPNRALMQDRLESAMALARRHGTHIAVLFLDIDHFRQINDSLGHAGGDEVLQLVARRLESVLRNADTVSRHGGDEFLMLLTDVAQASDVALIAAKLLSAIAVPCPARNTMLHLTASIGIAIYPEDGNDVATLIDRADVAMYRSKRLGPGGFQFHIDKPAADPGHEPSMLDVLLPTMRHNSAPAVHESRLRDLREANEQLVMAVLSAQELEAHAQEAHRRQIKFMAMVAHELRNPLTPIRVAASLLVDRDASDELSLARLQVIIDSQVTHMSRLIGDLLDGSRVSTGKLRLERSTVDMVETLSAAADTCRPAIESRRQHLAMRLPHGPLGFYGDPVRLTQIFSNLLDNASKYTPEGGDIALGLEMFDQAMVITVSDNGIGIAAEALPTIFDLFVQDAHALAHDSGGLGIGLAVVRDLVEAHGGTVVGKSAGRNLGSEFAITLPVNHQSV